MFYRTYTNDGNATGPHITGEANPATVSSFRLDKYMVTVGRFRAFANALAGGYHPAGGSGKHTHLNHGQGLVDVGNFSGVSYETGWVSSDDANFSPSGWTGPDCTFTSVAGANENLPMACANWYEAYAFCIWDGGFLPSSAEFEYAAAGGSDQRKYPWGTTDPGTSNQYAIFDCQYPTGVGPDGTAPPSCPLGVGNIAPVGTAALGAGRWGQLDLAGDSWEWTLDWGAPYVDPSVDGAYLQPGSSSRKAIVGGTWSYPLLPPSTIFSDPPLSQGGEGFRCARAP
jgi:formylglycine-generating enzyme required for sulfatase activity